MDEYGNDRAGNDRTAKDMGMEIDVEKTMKWIQRNPDKKPRVYYRYCTEVLMHRMGWANSKPPAQE